MIRTPPWRNDSPSMNTLHAITKLAFPFLQNNSNSYLLCGKMHHHFFQAGEAVSNSRSSPHVLPRRTHWESVVGELLGSTSSAALRPVSDESKWRVGSNTTCYPCHAHFGRDKEQSVSLAEPQSHSMHWMAQFLPAVMTCCPPSSGFLAEAEVQAPSVFCASIVAPTF